MQEITFVNDTGQYISSIFIGGGDCLHGNGLSNGSSRTIMYDADIRYWDVSLTFRNRQSMNFTIDLSRAWKVTFYSQNYKVYRR